MKYKFDKYRSDNDLWATLLEVFESGGEKRILYCGFGYYSHLDDKEKPYRMLEYCGFEVPLVDAVNFERASGMKYEWEFSGDFTQYIEDCSYEEMINWYDHYFNGEAPKEIPGGCLSIDTPCGCYYM